MSTEIKTITGVKESRLYNTIVGTSLQLTRFYGGAEKGMMLQLTVNNTDGYIQFTQEEVVELVKTLLNSFDDDIYPSD